MAGENTKIEQEYIRAVERAIELDAVELGKNIERVAKDVEQRTVWIEVRKDEINKSEQLKKELEYFSKSVLAELHREVFEKVLSKVLPLELIQQIDEYEETFENENKEEVWITERHEFDLDIQFNQEYYGDYIIIEKSVFGSIWYLELFILRKVVSKDRVRYLILREDLEYLVKYYTYRDLEILENVKAIIK